MPPKNIGNVPNEEDKRGNDNIHERNDLIPKKESFIYENNEIKQMKINKIFL